jgi:proteic killer suppression protein
MIVSFKHKGLKLFWEVGSSKLIPPDQITKIRHILVTLNDIRCLPDDLLAFRNCGIHKLKGDYKGYWSLSVKENWRIIFRFEEENVFDVNLIDYH